MIKNIKIKEFINIPLSRTTTDNIELNVPVNVVYEVIKPDDIIIGLFKNDIKKRVFVISNDIICVIVNRDDIEEKKITNVREKIFNKKITFGCSYFLAESII